MLASPLVYRKATAEEWVALPVLAREQLEVERTKRFGCLVSVLWVKKTILWGCQALDCQYVSIANSADVGTMAKGANASGPAYGERGMTITSKEKL
jgi:hypothetical protein